eukprot:CAMPEP_0171079424 /NCGR_PEP_ID=MMETSP0766_2-20121228/15247_1 /TAXON_ID=439317 /ORGANISM="Gambierdiscus australes, Strain CAWD 149" /LENGTH=167 /DNA_ID=CAMNT_0011536613 /DNA_START=551 /DNA_END=1054 /DNA_ORIENTATION=-
MAPSCVETLHRTLAGRAVATQRVAHPEAAEHTRAAAPSQLVAVHKKAWIPAQSLRAACRRACAPGQVACTRAWCREQSQEGCRTTLAPRWAVSRTAVQKAPPEVEHTTVASKSLSTPLAAAEACMKPAVGLMAVRMSALQPEEWVAAHGPSLPPSLMDHQGDSSGTS